ncbi:hypothetical protein Mangalitsa_076 [Escherichia phage Mangalitsa]|uniref:Uncharacterized protein n=1 Tax=Escherichia phage Mangalitsa TaxID=2589658 RepID=A0A5B9N1N9_9CAUD|nr:tail fiber protein [Escherichia phage Mangalitsa]QEG07878.1 hypothetical protein Mangalitsa_076 [Escherichia phage Mangalitsa]
MTNRLTFQFPWAQDGEVADPDLDTTNPSYVANRYADMGWEAEKPPNEWQNFLTQISDLKIMSLLFSGVAEFDSSVTYQTGAVSVLNGVVQIKVASGWEQILDMKTVDYLNDVAALKLIYDNHMAATNPHQDTVETLTDKSRTKEYLDAAFGSPTDPQTIVYHKLQQGRVHQETPEQVGTLPISGGTFTGPVSFLAGMGFATNNTVSMNGATGRLELRSGNRILSIDALGNVIWSIVGGEEYPVMTELNYSEFQIRWGNRFALPTPYLSMNLSASINDACSVRGWKISTTGTPAFHPMGGLKIDDNTVTFSGFDVSCPTTIVAFTRNASGTLGRGNSDAPSGGYTSLNTLLTNLGIVDAAYIVSITCYPTLTAYQKSMLVRP